MYLWQEDQTRLLESMFACELDAVIVKVAAMGTFSVAFQTWFLTIAAGLQPKRHLGHHLRDLFPLLQQLVRPSLTIG